MSAMRDNHGRFVQGHKGMGGRPKGMDFRTTVEEQASKHGVDLRTALWEVFHAQIERAKTGDTSAAKLVIDRLCPMVFGAEGPGVMTLRELVDASCRPHPASCEN